MKKTIASMALIAASTSTAFALMGMPSSKLEKVCLRLAETGNSQAAVACDESTNNQIKKLALKSNGCADNQVSITSYQKLSIGKCMPPGAIQL